MLVAGRVGKGSEHFRRQERRSSVKTDGEKKRAGRGDIVYLV
jgi:hypothetical protein